MWGIAHSQGIKLPTKDYWEFRDMITVSRAGTAASTATSSSSTGRSSSRARRSPWSGAVYEVVGGAYRKNNITTMELRFNPMKRNRGGEQDLDHIIAPPSAAWTGPPWSTRSSPGSSSASTGRSRTS
jgi:adenosine deaminase